MATYNNILNPTQDRDCWPKSDQGPMIPPEILPEKRGKKPLLRRKEPGEKEKEIGFTNGRVSRKGLKVKCSVCGVQGHNKRYHGAKVLNNMNNSEILMEFSVSEFCFC